MANKLSGLPSGFGRLYHDNFIIDGQFNEGKFHGTIKYVSSSDIFISNWNNNIR
jgi:hypothetical protein